MKKLLPLFLIMLFVLSTSAQEVCSNFFPVASPDGNYLYFSSDRENSSYKIYRSNVDGTNVKRVTSSTLVEFYARLSPDGTKLVFQAGGYDAATEIYMVNTDGTNLTRLTDNGVYDGMPSFSPDGEKIVFDAWDDSSYPEIFIMNVDGTDRVQLTNEPGAFWQSAPLFNPSGSKIYFSLGFNADNQIMSMNPDGSNWEEITPPNEFGYAEAYINFNPDGSKLMFTTTEWNGHNGPFDIVSCNPDGSDWQRLTVSTSGDGSSYTGCYSADGSKIYFGNDRLNADYIWDIFSMNADGSNHMMIVSCSNLGIEDPEVSNTLLKCNPNPLINEGFIEININKPDEVTFSIFDLSGRSVNADFTVSKKGILIKRGNLQPGIYLFKVDTESVHSALGKLVIR